MAEPALNYEPAYVHGHPARVLIVDDDAMLRTLIRVRLKKFGYTVLEASDGQQAIEIFENEDPDIILMDANMPGMNGFEATKALKALPKALNTPILMVSGLEDDESVDRAFSVGATEYITKPICWPLLTRRLSVICDAMRAEASLVQAKLDADYANQSKSEFLANMSHELRTPMHAILSFASMGVEKTCGDDDNKPEKLNRYFSRIEESGKRLLRLLNDLLDLSKLESGRVDSNFESVELTTVVDIGLSEFQGMINEKSLNVDVTVNSTSSSVWIDADKILQVVRNLLSNAIRFTPQEKSLRLHIKDDSLITDDARTVEAVSFSLADQGVGIPNEELESVFDKFVQSSKTKTGAGGTGLGLAICKEIVDIHNGKIVAANNEENGATFTVTLPRHAAE